MPLNPRHLDAFVATVRTGSTVAAARALATSQSSVSRMISDLEAELRMPLFVRERGRLTLTGEGALFLPEVDGVFAGLAELSNSAREIRQFRSAQLRVATIAAGALMVVPGAEAATAAQNPDLRASVFLRSHYRIVEMVAAGRVDVGVCNAVDAAPHVANCATFLPPCPIALPTGHRLAECDVVGPDDIENEAFISLGDEFYDRFPEDPASAAKLTRSARLKCNLSLPLARMVAAGCGVGLIDPLTAEFALGLRIAVRPFRPAFGYPISVITSAAPLRHRLVEDFIVKIMERLRSRCNS